MRVHIFGLVVAVLTLIPPAGARAAVVAVSFSGSGGTAVEFHLGNEIDVTKNFTSLGPIDMAITVDAAGTYHLAELPGFFGVFNNSGSPWIGFTLEILSAPAGSGFTSSDDLDDRFPVVTVTPNLITYSGGTLPGEGLLFENRFSPETFFEVGGPGTVVIREKPVIPEPASLVTFGIGGVAALLGYGWRRRRSAA